MLATIGYEKAELEHFVGTLQRAGISLLVDIRDRAQSRRRGFSKTALSTRLRAAGIEYIHFRALGDPKEGREAARAGEMIKFKKIFNGVMESDEARAALEEITNQIGKHAICLMCYERDHKCCHRKIVADSIEKKSGLKAMHLGVQKIEPISEEERRVLHSH